METNKIENKKKLSLSLSEHNTVCVYYSNLFSISVSFKTQQYSISILYMCTHVIRK